MRNIKIMVYY